MQVSDLSPEQIERIKQYRYDRIIEKHEGPERWASVMEYYDPEFLELAGYQVLLPLERDHHPNVSLIRGLESADGVGLTLFLRDTTYGEDSFASGFLAICEKMPGEAFYLATVYHEWFIVENP